MPYDKSCVARSNFTHLISKLKVRLRDAKVHSPDAGADTFDITYMVLALMIIIIALLCYYVGSRRLLTTYY